MLYVILKMAGSTQDSDQEVWRGRPWIIPYAAIRTILIAVIAGGALFVENSFNVLYVSKYGLRVLDWTLIAFFLAWILAEFNLLLLRYTNRYVLRVDSLEIKVG